MIRVSARQPACWRSAFFHPQLPPSLARRRNRNVPLDLNDRRQDEPSVETSWYGSLGFAWSGEVGVEFELGGTHEIGDASSSGSRRSTSPCSTAITSTEDHYFPDTTMIATRTTSKTAGISMRSATLRSTPNGALSPRPRCGSRQASISAAGKLSPAGRLQAGRRPRLHLPQPVHPDGRNLQPRAAGRRGIHSAANCGEMVSPTTTSYSARSSPLWGGGRRWGAAQRSKSELAATYPLRRPPHPTLSPLGGEEARARSSTIPNDSAAAIRRPDSSRSFEISCTACTACSPAPRPSACRTSSRPRSLARLRPSPWKKSRRSAGASTLSARRGISPTRPPRIIERESARRPRLRAEARRQGLGRRKPLRIACRPCRPVRRRRRTRARECPRRQNPGLDRGRPPPSAPAITEPPRAASKPLRLELAAPPPGTRARHRHRIGRARHRGDQARRRLRARHGSRRAVDPHRAAKTPRTTAWAASLKLLDARGANHRIIRTGAPYDLVLANILARPLVGLSPDIARLTRPGGRIILSGLLHHQEPQVKAAYAGQGLNSVSRARLNGWSTLTYARPHGRRVTNGRETPEYPRSLDHRPCREAAGGAF